MSRCRDKVSPLPAEPDYVGQLPVSRQPDRERNISIFVNNKVETKKLPRCGYTLLLIIAMAVSSAIATTR